MNHAKTANNNDLTISSIGTETDITYTETQQGGNLLSWITSTTVANESRMAIKAFSDGRPDVACYIIGNYNIDLSLTDNNNRNVLHHLAILSNNPIALICMLNLLEKKSIDSSIINAQDKDGNTPAHYAIINNQHQLVELLEQKGANLKLKNKSGLYLQQDDDTEEIIETEPMSKVPIFIAQKIETNDDKNLIKNIEDIVSRFVKKEEVKSELPELSPLVTEVINTDSETFIDKLLDKFNLAKPTSNPNTSIFVKKDQSVEQSKNPEKKEQTNDADTDLFIKRLVQKTKQDGGAKSETPLSGTSDMARGIKNQAKDLHDRVIEKIKKLLKVDDLTAKAYKASLYSQIKKLFPELGNYDRAVQMEKMTTLEDLNSLDKKNIDEIKKYLENKPEKSDAMSVDSTDVKKVAKKEKKEKKEKTEETEKPKKTKKVKSESVVSIPEISTLSSLTSSDSITF